MLTARQSVCILPVHVRIPRRSARPQTPAPEPVPAPPSISRTPTISFDDLAEVPELPGLPAQKLAHGSDYDLAERRLQRTPQEELDHMLIGYLFDLD